MPDFVPPEVGAESQPSQDKPFTPPEAIASKEAIPVEFAKEGSAWERMTGSFGQTKKQFEQAFLGIPEQAQKSNEAYTKAWNEAKTPDERLDLVKGWMLEQKDKIAEMGIKGGAPAIGYRVGGPVGGFIGGAVGELGGNLYEGQPTTLGQATAGGIRGLSLGQTSAPLQNFMKWAGLDMAAQQAQSVIDTGKMADAQRMAESAKNAAAAALMSRAVDTGSRAASQARLAGEDAVVGALKDAHDLGLVLDPNKYGGNIATKAAGEVAGRSGLQQAASVMNAPKVDALMRRYVNMAEGVPANTTNFEMLRIAEAAPYRKVASISTRAANEVENWKNLQSEATDWAESIRTAKSREERNLARENAKKAQMDADSSFARIERYATNAGAPELANELKEARIRIAEIHAVERGFENKTLLRNFNAETLAEMHAAGVPMRGDMLTVARAAEAMPEVFGNPSKMSTRERLTRAGTMMAGGFAGYAGAGPGGAALAAGSSYVAPKIAQNILLNPFVQGATVAPKYGVTEMTQPANILQFATRQ